MNFMKVKDISASKLMYITLVSFAVVTVLTALLAPAIARRFYPLPPDTGAAFYGWQMAVTPAAARISYWTGFGLHILAASYIGYKGRGARTRPDNPGGVTKYNILMLAVNLFFVLLHLLQTYIWYDGLARDVPIWTSQGSVIVMLVLILFLMIPGRGLIWGKSFKPPVKMYRLVATVHGPFIMLALIYTFWFHPMDGNWGLLSGFVYMFLLFTQMILFNTRIHTNKGWIVLLEVFVAVHGTLITVYKAMEIWPMFLFGFLMLFFLTQLYTWKMPAKWKWSSIVLFFASILLVYGFIRGFEHLYEITFIPVALYGGALLLLLVGKLWEWGSSRQQN